jgi:hypothetical protein
MWRWPGPTGRPGRVTSSAPAPVPAPVGPGGPLRRGALQAASRRRLISLARCPTTGRSSGGKLPTERRMAVSAPFRPQIGVVPTGPGPPASGPAPGPGGLPSPIAPVVPAWSLLFSRIAYRVSLIAYRLSRIAQIAGRLSSVVCRLWSVVCGLSSIVRRLNTNALAPLGTRALDSRGTTPLGSERTPLVAPTARCGAIGCPDNAGPAERTTCRMAASGFTRRLGSELRRASSGRGSQSGPCLAPAPASLSGSLRLLLSVVAFGGSVVGTRHHCWPDYAPECRICQGGAEHRVCPQFRRA